MTRTVTVAASETQSRTRPGGELDDGRMRVEQERAATTVAVPTASVASMTAVYEPSSVLPTRLAPFQPRLCGPAGSGPVYGVATHLPSRSTRRRTVAGAASWKVTVSASPLPSPFGVSSGGCERCRAERSGDAIVSWLETDTPTASTAVTTIV